MVEAPQQEGHAAQLEEDRHHAGDRERVADLGGLVEEAVGRVSGLFSGRREEGKKEGVRDVR